MSKEPVNKPVVHTKQLFSRGTQEHRHDLFKLLLSKAKKNYSYKYRQPMIREVEHVHFFHTINDTTMRPNKSCTPIGGHYHDIEVIQSEDPNTPPTLKVGPAMEIITRKLPDGAQINVPVPVKFEGYDEMGLLVDIVDNHTHEYEYQGSEVFTAKGREAFKARQRSDISHSMSGPSSAQASKMNSLNSGEKADQARKHIRE